MNRFATITSVVLLAACSAQPLPQSQLFGQWGGLNIDVHDSTAASSVVFRDACQSVLVRAPVLMDSGGAFAAPGTVFHASDEELDGLSAQVSGNISGRTLALDLHIPTGFGTLGTVHLSADSGQHPTFPDLGCVE
jgi:hypothetical protein